MTRIDFGDCETLLRKEYNISTNETLYMKKIDIVQEGMKASKVEYDVFCKFTGNKLVKLNLSVCENTDIIISIPINITDSLDKFNPIVDIIMIYVIQQLLKMEQIYY